MTDADPDDDREDELDDALDDAPHDAPAPLVATCVWRCTEAVVTALDDVLGDPVDAYVNGSQVWIDDDGPDGVAIEWRLHPVAAYERPRGTATSEVFTAVSASIAEDRADRVPPSSLWDGLEAFAAYDDPLSPEDLHRWATARLGIEPTAWGVVDHEVVAAAWERAGRNRSIVADLLTQLAGDAPTPP
jgi:hypothetical protein